MTFPTEINAIQYKAMAKRCAAVEAEITDEASALMFPGSAEVISRDNVIESLWRRAKPLIRHSIRRNDRDRVDVYRGELIIGALDPAKPNGG